MDIVDKEDNFEKGESTSRFPDPEKDEKHQIHQKKEEESSLSSSSSSLIMVYNEEEIKEKTKPKGEGESATKIPPETAPDDYYMRKNMSMGTVTTIDSSIDQHKKEKQDKIIACDYEDAEEKSEVKKRGKNKKAKYSFHSFVQKQAMSIARYPKLHFWISFIVLLIISTIGLTFGNFTVTADNTGWSSRGTTISDRFTQIMLITNTRDQLFSADSMIVWEIMQTYIQTGWEKPSGRVLLSKTAELSDVTVVPESGDKNNNSNGTYTTNETNGSNSIHSSPLPKKSFDNDNDGNIKDQHNNHEEAFSLLINRNLQQQKSDFDQISSSGGNSNNYNDLLSCDWDWYTDGRMDMESNLYPIWKVKDDLSSSDNDDVYSSSSSALDSDVIREICTYEQNTLEYLEQNGLCFGCDNGKCLMPYSIVLYVRSIVPGGMFMNCNTLANAWGNKPQYKEQTEDEWKICVDALNTYGTEWQQLPDACGESFYPSIVDNFFHTDGAVKYTSSIFATRGLKVDQLYNDEKHFDRGGGDNGALVEGVYDTMDGSFQTKFTQESLIRDILLGFSSGIVTIFAILLHTRSPFLTFVGVLEILFSFPLAYFVYYFVLGLEFFPFLNFIGIFVVFALGADHIFVAVDKWKNTRIKYPYATTEQIAAIALPDAAGSMFLTTATTSIAFFTTAICRVAPVRVFGIFCGLLVVWDYIVDILLIFPCLCIYDKNKNNPDTRSICFHLGSNVNDDKNKLTENDQQSDNDEEQQQQQISIISLNDTQGRGGPSDNDDGEQTSLIHRILVGYYTLLHNFRWLLLLASISAICSCGYYSTTLKLPSSSEIVLLSDDIEYIQHSKWRRNIFIEELKYKATIARTYIIWGSKPADTGNLNNPQSWSTVELDKSFDPSSEKSQIFFRDFCPSLFQQEFAMKAEPTYECAMNKFDYWLQEQSNRLQDLLQEQELNQQRTPLFVYPDPIYMEHCANATELPIPQDVFHPCIVKWSKRYGEKSVLSLNGIVKTIDVYFLGRAKIDSPNRELYREYNLIQNWISMKQSEAPSGVSNFFFGSFPFWNFDTQSQMFSTAFSSALTALGVAALVILLYSRSITMMIFSVLSIAYVLVSVTSVLVTIGWTLGFLESICFSILIGISVDFVIHFSHAYISLPGDVNRNERTKHALIHMGPSILAAAFTTLSSSTIMLFTRILFFQKFGIILCLTVIQATIGSFVVFLTLTDCFGPSNPTYMVDSIIEYICSKLYGGNGNNFYTRGRYSQGVFSITSSMLTSLTKLNESMRSVVRSDSEKI